MRQSLYHVLLGVLIMTNLHATAQFGRTAETPVPGSETPTEAKPRVTVLENGLTVLVMEDHRFPLVSQRLYVHAGSAWEDPAQAGISHLLEHMVFKGTKKRGPGQVAADVEGLGGALNAATSFDYTVYYVDLPSEHWKLGVDVINDMTFGAAIDPQELEQEKKVVLSELERGEDNPSQKLFKTLQGGLWPDTSYAWPIIGTRESVTGVTRQDILDYIARFYQPQSMLLVVVGDVEEAQVLAEAQKYFGGLKNDRAQTPPATFAVPERGTGPMVTVEKGKWNTCYVGVAFPVPGLTSDASVGLDMLAHVLGGDKASRFYNHFKHELRLVDEISVFAMTLQRGGMLYVSATLEPEKLDAFWAELTRTLAGLPEAAFSAEEIQRARVNLEDSLFQSKETLSGLASKLGYFQFFENGQQAEDNYLYSLSHVGAEQLASLARRYLRPDVLSAAVLLPENAQADNAELTRKVLASWPGAAKAAAESGAAKAPAGAEVVVLGKGTVVLLPDPTLPYTALSLSYPGGDGLLSADEQGLAELTSRVLTRSTTDLGAQDLQKYLSDRAAALSASASRESFGVSAKYPVRVEADMLALVADVLTKPSFAQDEVGRAQAEQAAAIQRTNDSPTGLAFRHIFPFLFQSPGYAWLHLGEIDTVKGFTPEQVADYWKRQSGQPWVLSVCGEFDRAAVLALAGKLAKAEGEAPAYDFAAAQWGTEREKTLHLPGRNQTHLLRIYPVPGMDSPDSAGLELLRAALAGQSGILFRDLRDKQGLGYSVTAFLWQAPRTGFMAFYIGTEPGKEEAALKAFEQAAANLAAEPLPVEELARAKNLLVGDYYRENQSLSARSREASGLMAKNLPLSYNRDLIATAQKLGAADLQKLAARYLKLGDSYLLKVEP